MKAKTFEKSFATKTSDTFARPHGESFADGCNNMSKAVIYITPYTSLHRILDQPPCAYLYTRCIYVIDYVLYLYVCILTKH